LRVGQGGGREFVAKSIFSSVKRIERKKERKRE
jgi:hypothetical protein